MSLPRSQNKVGENQWPRVVFNQGLQCRVSIDGGTPKSSIFIGFSLTTIHVWGTPIYGNLHICILDGKLFGDFRGFSGISSLYSSSRKGDLWWFDGIELDATIAIRGLNWV